MLLKVTLNTITQHNPSYKFLDDTKYMCTLLYIYCIITDIMDRTKKRNQTNITSESLTKRTPVLDIYAVIIWQNRNLTVQQHSSFCSLHDRWHISSRSRTDWILSHVFIGMCVFRAFILLFVKHLHVYCCCSVPKYPFNWTSYVLSDNQ